MAREEATEQTLDELIDRAWNIAKDADTVSLVTIEHDNAIARPMAAKVDRERGVICFLTAANSRKVQQAQAGSTPATVYCAHGNGYVSFTGTLTVSNDRAKIRQLWSAFDKAWWESAEDPAIRVVTFHPVEAELWDGPNRLAAAALMLTAAVAGSKPKLGDHARMRVR